MQRKWLIIVGSTLTALVVLTSPGLAVEPVLPPPAGGQLLAVEIAPVQGQIMTLEGTLEKNQWGNHMLDGRVLLGDSALLESLIGQQIWVLGRHEGGATSLKVNVDRIERPVALNRSLPQAVTMNGKSVSFDQVPFMQKGTLMVPLRAVVEAAGGTVEWRPLTQQAYVLLANRTAYFTVGQSRAELQIHNALMRENLVAMDQRVVLQHGRMYISADALSNVLGMAEEVTVNEPMLALRSVAGQFDVPDQPAPVDLSYRLSWSGTTLQVTGKASVPDLHFAILLEGKVIAESDAQVKEGVYITNILVEGGAMQEGRLDLQISDPATGLVLATVPTGNHHR